MAHTGGIVRMALFSNPNAKRAFLDLWLHCFKLAATNYSITPEQPNRGHYGYWRQPKEATERRLRWKTGMKGIKLYLIPSIHPTRTLKPKPRDARLSGLVIAATAAAAAANHNRNYSNRPTDIFSTQLK